MSEDSINAAALVYGMLLKAGYTVTSNDKVALATDLFENGLLQGQWDCNVRLESGTFVRCINEDEYEQHMDEDDSKPQWDDMLGSTSLGYIWVTK